MPNDATECPAAPVHPGGVFVLTCPEGEASAALACELAREGHRLALLAATSEAAPELAGRQPELEALGGISLVLLADERVLVRVRETLGAIDAIVGEADPIAELHPGALDALTGRDRPGRIVALRPAADLPPGVERLAATGPCDVAQTLAPARRARG